MLWHVLSSSGSILICPPAVVLFQSPVPMSLSIPTANKTTGNVQMALAASLWRKTSLIGAYVCGVRKSQVSGVPPSGSAHTQHSCEEQACEAGTRSPAVPSKHLQGLVPASSEPHLPQPPAPKANGPCPPTCSMGPLSNHVCCSFHLKCHLPLPPHVQSPNLSRPSSNTVLWIAHPIPPPSPEPSAPWPRAPPVQTLGGG